MIFSGDPFLKSDCYGDDWWTILEMTQEKWYSHVELNCEIGEQNLCNKLSIGQAFHKLSITSALAKQIF